MKNQMTDKITEAILIARELNDLLHEDALHRMQLYKEYSQEADTLKWNPNLYQRCQLAETLYRKLISLGS